MVMEVYVITVDHPERYDNLKNKNSANPADTAML